MDFNKLPLNTQKCYTMCKSSDGCEIYIPVMSRDSRVIATKKDELQSYLDSQPNNPLKVV